ncbi:hypothetical protein Y032_0081g1428 [Ancylostoma ceylanicum]|nr:hypothetical protein Y032_0081g1428 [Ancylostoma ceylanicum]
MASSIWTLFLVFCVLSYGSNAMRQRSARMRSSGGRNCRGSGLPENIRNQISERIYKWIPQSAEYSCELEDAAATLVLENRSKISSGDVVEMINGGPRKPTFIADAVRYWSPELERMKDIDSFGCFFRGARGSGRNTAKLACLFRSGRDYY